ncbi:cyclopropane-fatty-acyl-phospholipid synthase family protein [Iamia sp.]|uniref:cyclopropane-fatty-acyl-phospholipid synthase family protein n=1 Tax=Iamia sp. TaxID=2722710 RepID=UPI002C0B09AD|nr:cyclopropane-fatty-acyl-phospholipid synthase family protein [Iamia sp.]HXH57201.1 cyclopropane-fatty-acyl-phospholipid synthase family protein [Iamia sp.]
MTATVSRPTTATDTAGAIRPTGTRPVRRVATPADRAARAVLRPLLRRLKGGRLTVIESDGSVHAYGEPTDLDVTIRLRTPAVWREVTTRASSGLGGSYIDGWWDTDDLTGLVRLAIRNLEPLDRIRTRWDAVTGPIADRARKLRPESLERDRRDIEAHYDLGNDFFELFLDPETMAYSCGLWDGVDDLASAQQAKFDRLLDLLDLSPGDRLVEIGTGWGGLAERAAGRGLRVTTCTISREQHALAAKRMADLGLSHLVDVSLLDYRELLAREGDGTFDGLVSVEMIEAVDWRDHHAYFSTCSRLLRPGGKMALQAITVPDDRYERAKTSSDFVKRYVFPGSCLPSVEVIERSFARHTDMRVTQVDHFTQDYARTLAIWNERLAARSDDAAARGYDDALQRLWEFYLCYCEGAYAEDYVSVVQTLAVKPGGDGS